MEIDIFYRKRKLQEQISQMEKRRLKLKEFLERNRKPANMNSKLKQVVCNITNCNHNIDGECNRDSIVINDMGECDSYDNEREEE